MYQRILCTIILAMLMFTIGGYGEAKTKDESVKMTEIKNRKNTIYA